MVKRQLGPKIGTCVPTYAMDNIIARTSLFSKPVLTYNNPTKTKIILHRLDPRTFNSQVH